MVGQFQQLEDVISEGLYFDADRLSLVDAAYAPLLMRIEILEEFYPLSLYDRNSRTAAWSKNLLQLDSVKESVPRDFSDTYHEFIRSLDSHYAKTAGTGSDVRHDQTHVTKGV